MNVRAYPQGTTVNVAYVRKELRDILPDYQMIDDVVAGARVVKSKAAKYLPIPNAHDTSDENMARYHAYKTRAVFYGVTSRTLEGFIGEMFGRDPVMTTPKAMEPLVEDVNGEGVGLIQMAKETCRHVLSKGRAGLFVDYPDTGGGASAADKEALGIRPVINMYKPTQIINWRTRKLGALTVLSLVVLEEDVEPDNNNFADANLKQWRVLMLDPETLNYTVQLYQGKAVGGANRQVSYSFVGQPVVPTDANGAPFKRIPFMFIGANNNDTRVDKPPMYDLADLNIAHYRNSADYEESCFICGQPTPVISGLNEAWVDKYFKGGVGLGSRAALPLPAGASAELLQAEPNTMPFEAMQHKERQMVAVGARLVEQASVQRTATEASSETESEKSTLASVSDNVSLAFEWALGFAAEWEGLSEADITFRLNKEFSIHFSTPEARAEAIKAWQAEAISFTEMRAALRKGGTATLPDQQARDEIKKDADTGAGPNNTIEFDEDGNPIDPRSLQGNLPGQRAPSSNDPVSVDE